MTDKAKLRFAELKVLKREEETLKTLLSKYRNQLNALKVEELTLFKLLGTSQDRDRLSRNSTPNDAPTRPSSSSSRPSSRLSSRASSGDAPPPDFDACVVNETQLRLNAEPLLCKMSTGQQAYEEEEDDED
ncbi:snRNA-activating protein complex subunit 5 [Trinorchestia longiramus]|nr:snRNA-activating protein complex subunit 5 [Trinorchestia longiramus]